MKFGPAIVGSALLACATSSSLVSAATAPAAKPSFHASLRIASEAAAADHSLVLLLRGYRRQAFFWGVRALVGSNRETKARGFKYACEALSPRTYAWAVSMYRKLAVRPGHRPLAGRD